jgi:hypothetical protein
MRIIAPNLFRSCTLAYAATMIAIILTSALVTGPQPVAEINNFIFENYYLSEEPNAYDAAVLYLSTALLAVALVGMWFYWGPSRWLFLVATGAFYYMTWSEGNPQFLPTATLSTIGALENTFAGILIAMSFLDTAAPKFRREHGMERSA